MEDFTRINKTVSSEMLLSIMTLLHDRLPCSEGFFLSMRRNVGLLKPKSLILEKDSASPVRTIASPKFGMGLSPVFNMMRKEKTLSNKKTSSFKLEN